MAKIGGPASVGASFSGSEPIGPSWTEFIQQWGDATRENSRRMKTIEDWVVGPGSNEVDLAGAIASTMAGLKKGGWIGAVAAVLPQLTKVVYGNHLPSRYAEWLANVIAPDTPGIPRPGMGWVPESRPWAVQQQLDLGLIGDQTTAIEAATSGLTGEDVGTIALAVWQIEKMFYPMVGPSYNMPMFEALQQVQSMLTQFMSSFGLPIAHNPDFTMCLGDAAWIPDVNPAWGSYPDILLPIPIDFESKPSNQTLLDYLLETQPGIAWSLEGPDGSAADTDTTIWAPIAGVYGAWWRCLWNDRKLALLAGPTPNTSPAWPGLDRVTLGTPVPFTGTLYHAEVMDGFLLSITDPPPGQSAYEEAGTTRYKGLGWIAFHSDNGDLENHQQVEWPFAVYTPKTMEAAAAVDVWTKPRTGGILTPWVRNP